MPEKPRYRSRKAIVDEYPVKERLRFFDEQLKELQEFDTFLSKYGTNRTITQSIGKFLESFKLSGSGGKEETKGAPKDEASEVATFRKQIAETISEIREQKKNYEEIKTTAYNGPRYDELRNYLLQTWPSSRADYIRDLISHLGKVSSIITTIFDTNIENSIVSLGKRIKVITGVDRQLF